MREFKTLIRFAKPYKWWIILATICMIVVTGMNMLGPWAITNLIETVKNGANDESNIKHVTFLALIVVSIYLIRAFTKFGTDYVSHYAAWSMLSDIRSHLYAHIQGLSLKYFKDKKTGDLMARVIDDTRNFEVLLAHAIPTIVVNVLMFIGVTIILFSMNVTLTLYIMIPVPVLAWLVLYFSKVSRPLFRKSQDKVGEVNSILQDNFSGIKEIKAFNQEQYESNRTRDKIKVQTNAMLRALKLSNAYHPGLEFVSSIGTVIVIYFGGMLALNAKLPLEELVAFILYLNLFYQPITALGTINEGLQQAFASGERVLEVLSEEQEDMNSENALFLSDVTESLEFKDVSFNYVDNIPVIKEISFKVKKGESVALVGATGVGKTTLASLIPRFYDPTQGEIFIDGKNIKEFSLSSLRKQISLVSQDVFLFNGTVRENILYGNFEATFEELIEAAKAANAHEFIINLEKGYDTLVGERGVKLSGGQKQRISIARAILKNAPILILDEATSSVDTHTEKLIHEALNKLKVNKTAIIIAHRLSTVQDAEQIIVLKDGMIVESGTHEELIEHEGIYSKLYKLQNSEAYQSII